MDKYDPYQHAEELGINVIHENIRSANGLWVPDHNVIVIKKGMRAVHDRSALAHEVAHALLGHRDDTMKQEIQADRVAACNLLDYQEVVAAMRWVPDCHRLAAEMNVSTRLIRCFLNIHRLAGQGSELRRREDRPETVEHVAGARIHASGLVGP